MIKLGAQKWGALLPHETAGHIIDIVWWRNHNGADGKPFEFWCSVLGRVTAPDGRSDKLEELGRLLVVATNFRDGDDWHTSACDATVLAVDAPGGMGSLSEEARLTIGFKNENAQDSPTPAWIQTDPVDY